MAYSVRRSQPPADETDERRIIRVHDLEVNCQSRMVTLGNRSVRLTAKDGTFDEIDPVASLDVSILQNNCIAPIFGIEDPRTDKRIDFVGGIRGLGELERRCSTDMRLAFSMYPTSLEALMAIADAGRVMPPKSTWFEPKLLSGLFIHNLY